MKFIFGLILAFTTLILLNSCKDDCDETVWYIDNDADGFGVATTTLMACEQPAGYVANDSDIDDNDSRLNPNTAWQGETITITKEDNADWTMEANQDRITDGIWLTRKSNQGLFNIVTEEGQVGDFSTTLSPAGTEWALGSLSDGLDNLTFDRFVGTLNNNVGDYVLSGPMVLHLIAEDIYIDIEFNSWASGGAGGAGGAGGFSYTRTTAN